MAYSGSTAASSVANPPRCMVQAMVANTMTTGLTTAPSAPGAQGSALWAYCSTNQTTDIVASNFFSDGYYLGMHAGDFMIGSQFTSAGSSVISFTGVITGVSTSGASLSTGSVVTSTFA